MAANTNRRALDLDRRGNVRSYELALEVVSVVSQQFAAGGDVPATMRRLCEAIAHLVGARRAAFWRLGPDGAVSVQPEPFGFRPDSPIFKARIQLERSGTSPGDRVAFRDEFDLSEGAQQIAREYRTSIGLEGVKDAIAASWRDGDEVLGTLVAYDSETKFSDEDVWVLRIAARASALAWKYRQSESELQLAIGRLLETDRARHRLLKEGVNAAEKARRRLANELHDDALQTLTAAELQLQRLIDTLHGASKAEAEQVASILSKAEATVRNVLFAVHPTTLEQPSGLAETIRERLDMFRASTGVQTEIDLRLPDGIPYDLRSMVYSEIAEAVTNAGKHASARRVVVMAESRDGGIHVKVTDDGVGFDITERENIPGHIGLLAMKERAQLAGGWWRIDSEPGTGTTVEFWVPLS